MHAVFYHVQKEEFTSIDKGSRFFVRGTQSFRKGYPLTKHALVTIAYACLVFGECSPQCTGKTTYISGCVTRVTRWVSQVEQHLLILPEDLSSPQVFSGLRVARSLFFCVMICRLLFVLFLLAIALSVLLITPLAFSSSSCISITRKHYTISYQYTSYFYVAIHQ